MVSLVVILETLGLNDLIKDKDTPFTQNVAPVDMCALGTGRPPVRALVQDGSRAPADGHAGAPGRRAG